MPSPFPGMDPFLERPSVFSGLHGRLITYLEDAIQPLLPPPYFAKSGQRVWVEYSERRREPVVSIVAPAAWQHAGGERGGVTALAGEIVAEPVVITLDDVPSGEFRETFLDVFTVRDGEHRLVTAIEILSPSNKTPGETASELYLERQRELLASNVNVVEIDLLRAGVHATAAPQQKLQRACGRYDYHICVRRFDRHRELVVYAIQLPQRLPTISIPLLPGTEAVSVDLQAVFDRCYDAGPYRREVDYSQDPPPPPLSPNMLAWVKGVLAKAKTPR